MQLIPAPIFKEMPLMKSILHILLGLYIGQAPFMLFYDSVKLYVRKEKFHAQCINIQIFIGLVQTF